MNKRNNYIVIVVFSAMLVVALFFSISRRGHVEVDSGYRLVMGTFARIVVIGPTSKVTDACIRVAFSELDDVDELMSDYKSDSEISIVNRNAFERPVRVSESTYEVLRRSIEFSELSGGAFDITVGPLVDLLHSAEEEEVVLSEELLEQARARVGFEKLELDVEERAVRFDVDGMRLDLGGIAKGYAIDRAVEAMKKCGAVGGMVDVGGDIRCFGVPPRGKKKWTIGVQDPDIGASDSWPVARDKSLLLVLQLADAAVATSGGYRRFVMIEGKKYSHIIDGKTGRSAGALASVTIISEDAITADALATAVSVMGAEEGIALIEGLAGTEAIVITSEPGQKLIKSSGAEKYVKE